MTPLGGRQKQEVTWPALRVILRRAGSVAPGGEAESAVDLARYGNYSTYMPMTIEQLAAEALTLPSEERALLADRLVESLDAAEVNRLDRLWVTEAKRRRDEVRNGTVQSIPGDEALARVRRSLGR